MHRFFLVVLALGFSTSLARSHQPAEAATTKTVRAGQTVTFTITLDKAPNFVGAQLAMRIGPKDRSPEVLARVGTATANEGETEFPISIAIPLGGPVGVWNVENLTFILPDREARPLKFNAIEFTVLPRRDPILPSGATLQVQ